ncbi:MAG: hypothetical protein KDK70_07360 [Myxococcales bacterium]|nr:hypothetical protein [Myxococcales bacterium]
MTRTRHPLVGAWGRAAAVLAVLLLLLDTGCARRFKLSDPDLAEAKESNALGDLRVYPSNRTISLYDEPAMRSVTIEREIRQRSRRERRGRILRRNTPGAIIDEGLLNGQKLLWVTFDRQCATPECAYGFVQVEDARYVLAHVPEREGYKPPRVHRSLVIKRHQMKKGHLRSLAEANQVYRLKRKRRVPTVFLEVKRANQDRVEERRDRESGV